MQHRDAQPLRSVLTVALATAVVGCSDATSADGPGLRVVVTPPQVEVSVGSATQLTATVRDSRGEIVTSPRLIWASTDTTVAVVSAEGVVTGRKLGLTRVFASVPGYDADATVRVVPPVIASVAVNPATVSMTVGALQQLTATVKDGAGAERTDRPVLWTSDNEAVAAVSPLTGVVTARAAGTAKIVATVDGTTGSAAVTVAAAATPPAPPAPAPNRGPTANFVVGCTNLRCTFTDASTNGEGAVVAWAWDFGDGQSSAHRNSDVAYPSAGSYTVALTVTDDKGATSTVKKAVSPAPSPVAQLVNRASGKCLSIVGGSENRGVRFVDRTCDGGRDQLYALPTGEGAGPLQIVSFSNRYVELDMSPANEIQTWSWHGGMQQRWTYTSTGQLRNFATNTCLRTPGGGKPLVVASCAAEPDQQWNAVPR